MRHNEQDLLPLFLSSKLPKVWSLKNFPFSQHLNRIIQTDFSRIGACEVLKEKELFLC